MKKAKQLTPSLAFPKKEQCTKELSLLSFFFTSFSPHDERIKEWIEERTRTPFLLSRMKTKLWRKEFSDLLAMKGINQCYEEALNCLLFKKTTEQERKQLFIEYMHLPINEWKQSYAFSFFLSVLILDSSPTKQDNQGTVSRSIEFCLLYFFSHS